MAGDMCATIDTSEKIVTNSKIFSIDGVLFGFCGSFRLINVMYHCLQVESSIRKSTNADDFAFNLCTKILEVGDKHKIIVYENGQALLPGSSQILVVYDGKIILVGSDLSYVILKDTHASIGVADHAEGYLAKDFKNPTRAIDRAMKVAARSNSSVSEDYYIMQEEQ